MVGMDEHKPEVLHPAVEFYQVDLLSQQQIASAFEEIDARHGQVNVLINNSEEWQSRTALRRYLRRRMGQAAAINLRAPFLCAQAAVRLMVAAGEGVIINIGTLAGLIPRTRWGAHYYASKAALSELSRVMALELGLFGIRVNCLAPGPSRTYLSNLPSSLMSYVSSGRVGGLGNIVETCSLIAGGQTRYGSNDPRT